jgi:hypothetical protein
VLLGRLWLSTGQFLAGFLLPALAVAHVFAEGLLALCVLCLKLCLATLKTSAAASTISELRRQLITARAHSELCILLGVGVGRLFQDLFHLRVDRLVGLRLAERRVGRDFRAVQSDQANRHQAGLGAQLQNVGEQVSERLLMTSAKPRDSGVIRSLVRADHAERDILHAAALDHPRRALADGIRVEQQRDHHLRVKRCATPAIGAIGTVDPAQIDLLDRVKHTPRQVILAQPVAQARGQQQLMVTITNEEILPNHRPPKPGDTAIVFNPPDNKPQNNQVYATASNQPFNVSDGLEPTTAWTTTRRTGYRWVLWSSLHWVC